eukprot:TRINITY_DN7139_c0_g1_i4.p1 TRINITY_DN7139_c0_g1~~TRINITY_DN7139_c0_g1_i4.p1  ORF type:complete len:297 (+),score=55.19 TRINITY_DN7139_c0_g1_i4:1566-2456(+)
MDAIALKQPSIDVTELNFDYGGPPVLKGINLSLFPQSRCLLVGINGAGKSTLLKIIAGKCLTKCSVQVLGCHAYQNTPIGLTYLGVEWAKNPVVWRDIEVATLLETIKANDYPERRDKLMDLLDVDIKWHMHEISDGERRRVQLLLGLIQPYSVLLLDEVTSDLDLVTRVDLLNFLKEESETRGVTIIYATHIFDGVEGWASEVAHLSFGSIVKMKKMEEIKSEVNSLGVTIETWLRTDHERAKKERKERKPQPPTRLKELKNNYVLYREKYLNYWKNKKEVRKKKKKKKKKSTLR